MDIGDEYVVRTLPNKKKKKKDYILDIVAARAGMRINKVNSVKIIISGVAMKVNILWFD